MADLEREPFWQRAKAWDIEEQQAIRKIKLEEKHKGRCEVIPCDGKYGLEFLYSLTLVEFAAAYKTLAWAPAVAYEKVLLVLTGEMRVAWEEMLDNEYADLSLRNDDNWQDAVDTFVRKYTNCKRPRDVQFRSLEKDYIKPYSEHPASHFRRFKESYRNTLRLPKGFRNDPTDEEIKEWYFLTYCKKHRQQFITSGLGKDDLKNSSMEDITDFMRLLHETDMSNGTVAKMMLNDIKSKEGSRRARESSNRSSSYRQTRADRRRDQRRNRDSTRSGRDERRSSRRHEDSRNSRDRGRERTRDSRNGRDEKRDRDRQRDRKPEFYRSDKRDCKKHRPCQHTWDECKLNPRNQRGSSGRRHESHYQDDDVSLGSNASAKSRSRSRSPSGGRSPSRSPSPSKASDSDESHEVNNFHLDIDLENAVPRKGRKIRKLLSKGRKRLTKVGFTSRDGKKAASAPQKEKKKKIRITDSSDEELDEFAKK